MEETTTDAVVQETGADIAQPEEQQAEAVTNTDSEPQQSESSDDDIVTAPSNEDNAGSKTFTPEWLQSKGIDLAAPDAAEKLAKMAYNAEKQMSRTINQVKSSELEKTVSTQSAGQGQSTTDMLVGAMLFKQTHPELTNEQDSMMGSYLTNNPQKLALLQNGLITYDDLYAMSGASSAGQPDADTLKKQGSQEALQQLANKQRATAVRGNASANSTPAGLTKANVEAWYDSLGTEGRRDPANIAKLNDILSS